MSLRVRKRGVLLVTRLRRRLGWWLRDRGDALLIAEKRRNKKPKKRGAPAKRPTASNFIPWQHLLLQFGDPRSGAALIAAGGFGRELPRDQGLPSGDRILIFAAHQDDETIAAAGTFLLCAKAGKAMKVVYYTEAFTAFAGFAPEEAVQIREDEANRIWERIAGVQPVYLNHPNRADRMARGAPREFADIIREFRPTDIFLPSLLEQAAEHRLLNDVLLEANRLYPLPETVTVWGYQTSTCAPGTAIVDITTAWREKYAINAMWESQNLYGDYAHVGLGRDIFSTAWLKGSRPRRLQAYAETFVRFPAPQYLDLYRALGRMPESRISGPPVPPPNFFIVGMQKSGTFWLTALLDAHPQVRCFPARLGHPDGIGEAHLFDTLAKIETDFDLFAKIMRRRLGGFFTDLVPARKPATVTERQLLIDAVRGRFDLFCQLQRLRHGKPVVGEKTTESCHHPDLINELYPNALCVAILRDPRDRVVSFFFHQQRKGRIVQGASLSDEFVDAYIDRVRRDYEGLLAIGGELHVMTYEALMARPRDIIAAMCRTLGVTDDAATIEAMFSAGDFKALSGRDRGDENATSHFRKGVVGDWQNHLTADQARRIVAELDQLTRSLERRFVLDLGSYRADGTEQPRSTTMANTESD